MEDDDGFKRVWSGDSVEEMLERLTTSERKGLLRLAQRLDEDMLDDPEQYGYGRDEFKSEAEYNDMLTRHRAYGRLADMDTYILFRNGNGWVSINTIMTMSHIDRYHYENGKWRFEEP